jgi:hypothetical protein
VDARAAFGSTPANYTQSDGIHPTTSATVVSGYITGGQKWANEVVARQFSPWTAQLGLGV